MSPELLSHGGLVRAAFTAGVIFILQIPLVTLAQQGNKVRIERAAFLRVDKKEGRNVQWLVGDVMLRQDSTYFYCDSAALDEANNMVRAFGNVHITHSDSVEIFGKYMIYNGNTRLGVLDSNVRLFDGKATLFTEHLNYDRNAGIAHYDDHGRIVDEENNLTSITGRYYNSTKEYFFKDSVVVTNPDWIMYADTLRYNTRTEVVFIEGPTRIIGKEDRIYSEQGWYDTRLDRAELTRNNLIIHESRKVRADLIYYDREGEYGMARGNVWLADTTENVEAEGEIGEFFKDRRYGYLTGNARAMMIDGRDTLFMHADTFRLVTDSADQARYLLAYRHMKFYRDDMQGMCDSLVYDAYDSVIHMLHDPVLWSDENQLTADSIRIFTGNNSIDSLALYQSAFIISLDTMGGYNQIKGKQMRGYLGEGQLRKIRVLGNAETIYYVRDENNELIGINVAIASDMGISVNERKVRTIAYYKKPDATLFPDKELPDSERLLKGFIWIEGQRPASKEEIFFWKED